MKKLLMTLFFGLSMLNAQAEEKTLYEIDPAATADAPWKIGEVVESGTSKEDDIYRTFVGINSRGEYLVQTFYKTTNAPFTSVVRLTKREDVTKPMLNFCALSVEGLYVMYGFRTRKKVMEGHCHAGKTVGRWQMWDESTGKIKFEQDYGNMPVN